MRESEELIRGSTILDNTVLALWTPRAFTQFSSPEMTICRHCGVYIGKLFKQWEWVRFEYRHGERIPRLQGYSLHILSSDIKICNFGLWYCS